MDPQDTILVTGASGMIGRAMVHHLRQLGFSNLLAPSRQELDLCDHEAVDYYFRTNRPRYVMLLASKVGGILANQSDPVSFLDQNVRMYSAAFAACHRYKVDKTLFLGSSCIYPRLCNQPIQEDALLTGPLEPTNEGYALAKIVGLKLAEYYHRQHGLKTVCPMLCNVYGTGDCFDLNRSHVLSALVRRFCDAVEKRQFETTVWGTGTPRREFIHVDDAVRGLVMLMETLNTPQIINLGTGYDVSIKELATEIAHQAGYRGKTVWDSSKPDGMPRKCMDCTKIRNLGFRPQVSLDEGIARTISEYRSIQRSHRMVA
jgi:GDP-L-fucose synthase